MATIKRFATTHATTDIKLAASLLACGIPPVPGEEVNVTSGDLSRVAFNFLPASVNGQFHADDLMGAWRQEQNARTEAEAFHTQNPEHPMSYLMAGWKNYLALRDYVMRATPMVYLKRGSSVAMIDPNSERHIQDHILGKIGA